MRRRTSSSDSAPAMPSTTTRNRPSTTGSRDSSARSGPAALVDRIEYAVDGPFRLDDVEKTVEMTMPARGEMPCETEPFAHVVVSNGVPRGHVPTVVKPVRDDRSKRLGSVSDRFGPTIEGAFSDGSQLKMRDTADLSSAKGS